MLEIEHPLTGDKLQVANQDFSNRMTWDMAIRACNELGGGWRLPSVEELKAMYEQLHKKGKGNFKAYLDHGPFVSAYWSSQGTENDDINARYFSFYYGFEDHNLKHIFCSVRAVRAI